MGYAGDARPSAATFLPEVAMPLRYSRLLPSLVAALLCGSLAATAAAAIPSPSNCTVPPGLVTCPEGDVTFTVVVRDIAGFPVAGSTVELDFGACPDLPLCEDCCPGVTIDRETRRASVVTRADGQASFALKSGGVCGGQHVLVRADGVLLAGIPEASPDQDGNLYVGTHDLDLILPKMGTQDPTADFDLDGRVTQADLDWMFPEHAGVSCNGEVVGARRPSWGALKILYR
jgi:hypothetical protein